MGVKDANKNMYWNIPYGPAELAFFHSLPHTTKWSPTQQLIWSSIFSLQSMSENPFVYHKQFILNVGAIFVVKEARKDIET